MWGRLGEIGAEYLRKGSQVYIEGRLQTRKWQDKATGNDRYSTEIVASEMQMLGGRGGGGGADGNPGPARAPAEGGQGAGQGRRHGPLKGGAGRGFRRRHPVLVTY